MRQVSVEMENIVIDMRLIVVNVFFIQINLKYLNFSLTTFAYVTFCWLHYPDLCLLLHLFVYCCYLNNGTHKTRLTPNMVKKYIYIFRISIWLTLFSYLIEKFGALCGSLAFHVKFHDIQTEITKAYRNKAIPMCESRILRIANKK